MQLPRCSGPFVCVLAVAAVYYAALYPVIDDLTRLERLVHKIEHTPKLSTEAMAAIDRAVEEARTRAGLSEQAKAKREAAIARVLGAVKAKQTMATAGAI